VDEKNQKYAVAQSIVAVTALFAALVGFGLQDTLPGDAKLRQDAGLWPFIVAVPVALRFVTGSANHLWHTYVRSLSKDDNHLILDLAFLVVLGCVLAVMCHVDTSYAFTVIGVVFFGLSLFWGFLDGTYQKIWWFWIPLDLLHGGSFALVSTALSQGWSSKSLFLWFSLALVGVLILFVDFKCQLIVMSHGAVTLGWLGPRLPTVEPPRQKPIDDPIYFRYSLKTGTATLTTTGAQTTLLVPLWLTMLRALLTSNGAWSHRLRAAVSFIALGLALFAPQLVAAVSWLVGLRGTLRAPTGIVFIVAIAAIGLGSLVVARKSR
jgi:hypothetical protein